ncbi:MAG: hypothetical protein HC778_08900 [Chamaesiphon sp. CSU_1_12]|nr:hypothetical protein [Chamaesiphon sp. CSU_1_12]
MGLDLASIISIKSKRRFKRAVLGTMVALLLGTVVANLLVNYAHLPVNQIGLRGEIFAGLLTLILLWVASSFTK